MTSSNDSIRPIIGTGLSDWTDSLLNLFWECDDVVRNPNDGEKPRELPDRVLRAYEDAEKARQAL
jgi:hypothetical protein